MAARERVGDLNVLGTLYLLMPLTHLLVGGGRERHVSSIRNDRHWGELQGCRARVEDDGEQRLEHLHNSSHIRGIELRHGIFVSLSCKSGPLDALLDLLNMPLHVDDVQRNRLRLLPTGY